MMQYADHPMDLADASLVAVAEAERLGKIFTIDRNDFATYRMRCGRSLHGFEIIG
jgi:predicted nucleic acid-binding protein